MTMTTEDAASTEEFNGWPNRETWAASLHLSNDYGLYEMVNGWANDARREAIEWQERNPGAEERYGWKLERAIVTGLADKLRYFIEDIRVGMQAGHDPDGTTETERAMVLEIGSEWRVDWVELARNWLEGFEFEGEES